jgi:cobyrinic acid a,c-diamide synthase
MSARLLIAGVSSGVGKTTFTLGLCAALRRRGLAVSVFKCGPDYLDPTYHRVASGRGVHNLDSWLMSGATLRASFSRHAADVSLIEGVMGLFDGASPTTSRGSSAEIAKLLECPIALVCDASGMARSVAALAHGFMSFDPDVRIQALICNRVGSRSHLDLLRSALGAPTPTAAAALAADPGATRAPTSLLLGGLCKNAATAFPERHLGLRTARELDLTLAIEGWADQVEGWCDVDGLLALARSAPPFQAPSATALPLAPAGAPSCRIGVADDAAFHFYYDENLALLERAGATLVRFSPLTDQSCGDVDGIYIGGGYPELYARQLSDNHPMLASLRAHAESGRPLYAECGGLMYLSDAIATLDGSVHPMLGLIPGQAVMAAKLRALGYVEVETRDESPLGPPGTRFRGHQFRYSHFEAPAEPARYALEIVRSGDRRSEGYGQGNVLGSYVHAHWAETPDIPACFVDRCVTARMARLGLLNRARAGS